MGYTQAQALANLGDIKLENQIQIHLQSNHYPPVPSFMVKPCIEAINLWNELDYEATVSLPEGVSYKGEDEAPVREIINQHHLHAWLHCDEY